VLAAVVAYAAVAVAVRFVSAESGSRA
jgi:hypothetical protein